VTAIFAHDRPVLPIRRNACKVLSNCLRGPGALRDFLLCDGNYAVTKSPSGLSHPHGDHAGGCAPTIDAIPVRLLFDSAQQYSGRAFRDCVHEATTHNLPIVRPLGGYRWTDDGATLDILAPSFPILADTGDDINENSIVTRLTYVNESRLFHELFMGDAGESSEARLLASGIDLRAEVLKVGHHGSR
jgi:competence protein ComEC